MIRSIQITQEHINAGRPRDCGGCPIALAIKEVIGPDISVTVNTRTVFLKVETYYNRCELDLPEKVSIFIKNFDSLVQGNQMLCRPFFFKMYIPTRFLKGFPDE